MIATKSPNPDVLLFDYRRHPSKPTDNKVKADLVLKGHTQEGFDLAFYVRPYTV